MSSQQTQDRGRLFENKEKRKPSQPSMQGEVRIGGRPFTASAWDREDQLVIEISEPRERGAGKQATTFRGALDPAPRTQGEGPAPKWAGEIETNDSIYAVRAYEQQGKSGTYLSLELERLERNVEKAEIDLTLPPID